MTNRILIEHLPLNLNSVELTSWASAIAPVLHAEVFVDSRTGRGQGKGIVTYESVVEAARAVTELVHAPVPHGGTVQITQIVAGHPV